MSVNKPTFHISILYVGVNEVIANGVLNVISPGKVTGIVNAVEVYNIVVPVVIFKYPLKELDCVVVNELNVSLVILTVVGVWIVTVFVAVLE